MEKKLTKTQKFEDMINIFRELGREDLIETLQHEIDLINKKSQKAKAKRTNGANADIKAKIVEFLTMQAEPMTVTDILNANDEINSAVNGSNQKASALITQLVKDDIILREVKGGRAKFSIAPQEQEEVDIMEGK